MSAIVHASEKPAFLAPAPSFSFFEQAVAYEQEPVAYHQWRVWRYEHVSLEFQAETYRIGRFMWEQRRLWWTKL